VVIIPVKMVTPVVIIQVIMVIQVAIMRILMTKMYLIQVKKENIQNFYAMGRRRQKSLKLKVFRIGMKMTKVMIHLMNLKRKR
jgi:hypothetical protein